jgi:uncharacterized protein YciI
VFVFTQNNANYNAALADSLGADNYGMKSYVLIILRTGPNEVSDKNLRAEYFKSHFANMKKLSDAGKLIVSGPVEKNENQFRGIFILDAANFEEANTLLEADLTVKEKIFEAEMYKWYGSAALPLYLPYHQKIEKLQIQ